MKNIGSLKNNLRFREFSGILIFNFYILNISIITLRYSCFLLCIIAIHTLSQPLYCLLGLMTRFTPGNPSSSPLHCLACWKSPAKRVLTHRKPGQQLLKIKKEYGHWGIEHQLCYFLIVWTYMWLKHPKLQLPHLKNASNNNVYLKGLQWESSEIMCIKHIQYMFIFLSNKSSVLIGWMVE